MEISSSGHVVNADGETTTPMKTTDWVGDNYQRIYFDYMVMDDGYIALHSIYGSVEDQLSEDFLYEVHCHTEGELAASSMVDDAVRFLISKGVNNPEVHVERFLEGLKCHNFITS